MISWRGRRCVGMMVGGHKLWWGDNGTRRWGMRSAMLTEIRWIRGLLLVMTLIRRRALRRIVHLITGKVDGRGFVGHGAGVGAWIFVGAEAVAA